MVLTKSQFSKLGEAFIRLETPTRKKKMTKSTDSGILENQGLESTSATVSQPQTTDEKVDSLLGGMMGMKDSFAKFFSYIKENSPIKKSKKGRTPESPGSLGFF